MPNMEGEAPPVSENSAFGANPTEATKAVLLLGLVVGARR